MIALAYIKKLMYCQYVFASFFFYNRPWPTVHTHSQCVGKLYDYMVIEPEL